MLKRILTLAKKEFFSFINSVLAYVIIIPFLLISAFLYLRQSLVSGEATLRPFFEFLPWFLILLAPALSMKLLTDEQKENTIELLFAHPLKEIEIILAKFLGVFAFFCLILAATFGLPLSLLLFSQPDWGIIVAQYLGAALTGAAFLSLGLAASSFITNSIGSFLLAAAFSFGLILIGLDIVILTLPSPFNRLVSEIAILPHFQSIARGVIDIRDVAYFLSLIAIFLAVSVIKLSARKIKENAPAKRRLSLAIGLIIAIAFITNLLLQAYPLRLDLTKNRLFTLSAGTRQTIKNLPDIVNLTVYTSHQLPGPVQANLTNIQDLLKDYRRLSSKLVVKTKYPDRDPQALAEAQQAGVQEIAFNQIGLEKFEIQRGYLGLSLRYADQTETLPFIQDTSDLEYQLTRRIRKLTGKEHQTIGFYSSSFFSGQQNLRTNLETQFVVQNVDLNQAELKDIAALVLIDAGTSEEATAAAALKDYLDQGGKALIFASGVNVDPQFFTAQESQSQIPAVLTDYGLQLNRDLVYDFRLNETINLGQGSLRYLLPYPFWLKALPVDPNFPPLSGLPSLSLLWPSSISLNEKDGLQPAPILQTSSSAGKQTEKFTPSPDQIDSLPTQTDSFTIAALVQKAETKVILVSTANAVIDQYDRLGENSQFASSLVDWLIADETLAAIPLRSFSPPIFRFSHPLQPLLFQWGNLLLPTIIIIAWAAFWLTRRRHLTQRTYHPKLGRG